MIWSWDGDAVAVGFIELKEFMDEGWPRPGGVRGEAPSRSGAGEAVFQMLGILGRAGSGVYD